jgi:hypothetical protein
MSGNIKEMLDTVINGKLKDNPLMGNVIKAKMVLKGINLNSLTPKSAEDPVLMAKLEAVMKEIKSDATFK